MASKSKASADAKPIYTNRKAIVLSGGKDKGKHFEPGEYKGSLDHLSALDIEMLRVTQVIVEVKDGE